MRLPRFCSLCPSDVAKGKGSTAVGSPPFVDAPGTTGTGLHDVGPRLFSYAELYIGSCGFSQDEVLGSGGFGRVYRAVLPGDGTVVAVKCVAGRNGEDTTAEKALAAELAAVALLRHRNLVRLRGWCVHEQQLLLVYDYMPNRSLDRLLFGGGESSSTRRVLRWERRRRIVAGLAAALLYLHEQLDTQIIHRDVKASNVMLDSSYAARLGDFGLARWLEHDAAPGAGDASPLGLPRSPCDVFRLTDTTRTSGTVGYLPPENFQREGAVTVKSDVFSFGIVALEVVTGRRAFDLARPDEQIVLLDWVRQLADKGDLSAAVDRRLPKGSYPEPDVRRLVHVGLLCTLHDPRSRPSTKWVAEALSGNGYNGLPPLPTFKFHPNYYTPSSSSSVSIDHSHPRKLPRAFPVVDAPRMIALKEIAAITDEFSDARKVAELDFGAGYRGRLEDPGVDVLVKRLGSAKCPALRVWFADELRNLARLRHRNLVQLRGWCAEKGEMLVVYESSRTCNLLAGRLFHPRDGPSALPWRRRYGIIKALASAIQYLHEEQVIHRNISSLAVSVDRDLNPRLGCFALAEFLTRNEDDKHHAAAAATPATGRSARGIFGYMSPEYMEAGEATAMADVYSFGVVVLEVVSGEKAVDVRHPEVLLARRVHAFLRRRRAMEEIADWRLDGRYDPEELRRLVMVGLVCTHSEPACRPCMREVVSVLDGNDELLKKVWMREGREEWEERNACYLSLIRRIQAIGLH